MNGGLKVPNIVPVQFQEKIKDKDTIMSVIRVVKSFLRMVKEGSGKHFHGNIQHPFGNREGVRTRLAFGNESGVCGLGIGRTVKSEPDSLASDIDGSVLSVLTILRRSV